MFFDKRPSSVEVNNLALLIAAFLVMLAVIIGLFLPEFPKKMNNR